MGWMCSMCGRSFCSRAQVLHAHCFLLRSADLQTSSAPQVTFSLPDSTGVCFSVLIWKGLWSHDPVRSQVTRWRGLSGRDGRSSNGPVIVEMRDIYLTVPPGAQQVLVSQLDTCWLRSAGLTSLFPLFKVFSSVLANTDVSGPPAGSFTAF